MQLTVKHITLTGMFAGQPICGVARGVAAERGDTFAHAPYVTGAKLQAWLETVTCPECRREWDAADAEGDEDQTLSPVLERPRDLLIDQASLQPLLEYDNQRDAWDPQSYALPLQSET